jgi:hypothetical protein
MGLAEPFIIGGTAACFASAMLYPFHLTRVRLQLMDARSRRSGTPFHLMKILDKEGLRTAYAGFSTPLLRQGIVVVCVCVCVCALHATYYTSY